MLRGRGAEQSTIDGLIEAARAGTSGALILRGEPGIGKTALLEHAAGRAEGMRVLRGVGVESEAELPFAGLHLLLRSALDRLDTLPGPQRQALSGAFGLGAGGGDRFMIGAGVLSLLADMAEPAPLLCLVDDAQWLDRESVDALLFAARRLDREGVVILFAVRDYADVLTATGIPELHLAGLDAESAAQLLDDDGATLPAALREQLVTGTRGNPLALRELPSLVTGSRLGPMPLTSRVLDAFHHQVRSLPSAARTLLLLAAADDTGELPMLLRAAAELGVGIDDLQPAEERGLISPAGGTFVFRHPLVRAAVYQGAPVGQRIAAHRALASAYAGHRDADRSAWHLAVAATGPDEQVASDLERAAGRAAARNGYAAAASAYERAAQLSEDPAAATRRLTLACESAVHSGQLDWARARAERVARETADPAVQARLVVVRAAADFAQGALHHAHELLTAGAALTEDATRAFWMRMEALHAAWAAPTDRRLIAESIDRFDVGAPAELMPVAWLARWATAVLLDRDTRDFPTIDRLVSQARAIAAAAGPRALSEVASRAFMIARDDECADIATEVVTTARATGMLFALPAGLGFAALAHTLLGRHREALISGTEGLRIAHDTGQPLWVSYASGALAYLAATEGDEAECRRHADNAGLHRAAQSGSLAGATWAQAALALLDLGLGRVQAAHDRLQAVAQGPTRHQGAVVRCLPDLVETAVRLGLPATEPLAEYERWATTLRQPWIDALLARCHALTTADPEPHYQRALKLHEPSTRPFERARTELLYGEWLRRARRKADARAHLSSALQTFEDLDSAPWAARARSELGATGTTLPRAATSDVFASLTPQELQITQLAAQGMSNRDIAAQLYLSPRTVAYHLYKAYPKLGITSRGELASLAGDSVPR